MARATTFLNTALARIAASLAARYDATPDTVTKESDGWADIKASAGHVREVVIQFGDIVVDRTTNRGSDSSLPVIVNVELVVYDRFRDNPNAEEDSLQFITDLIAWGEKLHVVNGMPMEFLDCQKLAVTKAEIVRGLTFELKTAVPVGVPNLYTSTPDEIADYESPIERLGHSYTGLWPPVRIVTDYTSSGQTWRETLDL